jgi:hypothetical protein
VKNEKNTERKRETEANTLDFNMAFLRTPSLKSKSLRTLRIAIQSFLE